mmetsp:Transcript_1169/g.3426  ORF Transcript_1169/g.3426 Transcript_1169/m.3426 type:complete len:89 (+) Transcript_1169:246-512(+)
MASPAEVRALYRAFLRVSHSFPHYNLKDYIKRRAQLGFRMHAGETDKEALQTILAEAKVELQVAQRQSVVYSMYERPHRNVIDLRRKA